MIEFIEMRVSANGPEFAYVAVDQLFGLLDFIDGGRELRPVGELGRSPLRSRQDVADHFASGVPRSGALVLHRDARDVGSQFGEGFALAAPNSYPPSPDVGLALDPWIAISLSGHWPSPTVSFQF